MTLKPVNTFCKVIRDESNVARRSKRLWLLWHVRAAEFGLTVSADEALAETNTQTQEEDRRHAAHREEDDHGRTHYSTQTHTFKHCLCF